MPTINVKGQPVFYVEQSHGDEQQTLIMLHGAGGTHRIWLLQVNGLQNFRAIALDLPGHGRSGSAGRESITSYADFVLEFLGALGIEKAIIVGHSMGGAIALELALRQGPQIIGLILVGTGARLRVRPEFLHGLQENVEDTISSLVTWFYGSGAEKETLHQGEAELRASQPEVLFDDFSACDRFDVMQRLGEIGVPTLVICGDEDRLTPPNYAQYLRDHIPGARVVVVPGAGHMVMLEKPQEVTEAMQSFLDSVLY
ncbi:MAG: alpha/beta hydrolase [Chloroflexi bacterium]|nr:alpha/beta hydrolase [Chloroflexota bacterium]